MPAPSSRPHLPASSASTARMSFLVQLFLGGSLAAIGILLGLIVWRLAQLPHSGKPAAERPRPVRMEPPSPPIRVEIEPRKEEADLVQKVAVPISEPVANAATVVLPPPPKALTADQIFEQRMQVSEDELCRQLYDVPELRLLADEEVRAVRAREQVARGNTRRAASAAFKSVPISFPPIHTRDKSMRAVLKAEERAIHTAAAATARSDRTAAIVAADEQVVHEFNRNLQQTLQRAARRAGLPLQSGPRCQLTPQVAASVAQLSKNLRELGFVTALGASAARSRSAAEPDDVEGHPAKNTKAFRSWCDQNKVEWLSGSVPTLTQMLQIEDETARLLLVRELARAKNAASTVELADRAVMDLAPEVRRAAIDALSRRSAEHYLPILTRALRYPWPPVADHAAVALRTLQPQEAVAPLVDLLDLPSPSLPTFDARTQEYTQRELVRLNHLRNCLLCHAVSANKEDGLVRGLVPTPGLALPSSSGGGSGYYSGEGDSVRADITYLRQDFSTVLLDKDVAPWPPRQRFDFVTRQRIVPPEVAREISASPTDYPQRDAVLYALRGITGKDGGDSSAKWRDLLGIAKEQNR